MKRAVIEKLMKSHLICSDSEAFDALEFVRELVEAEAEELKKNEPHATRTIQRLEDAYRDLADLLDGLDGDE